MQNNRVYSATSVTEVINLLQQHRFSGVLSMRRVADPRQEEARVSIEQGRPMVIRMGVREEQFTSTTLSWLNSWGAIYFVFQPTEPALQLPAPRVPSSQLPAVVEPPMPPPSPLPSPTPRPRRLSSVTQPLSMSSMAVRETAGSYNMRQANIRSRIPAMPVAHERSGNGAQPAYANGYHLFDESVPTLALEMAIPSMTTNGHNYTITQIPRYDRTIFLLINGRRTVVDLAHLTKRTIDEVYASLYRLKRQELIIVKA